MVFLFNSIGLSRSKLFLSYTNCTRAQKRMANSFYETRKRLIPKTKQKRTVWVSYGLVSQLCE